MVSEKCSIICYIGPFAGVLKSSPLGANKPYVFFCLVKGWHFMNMNCQVKPENILVSCERAILCDFGVAETVGDAGLKRARHLGYRNRKGLEKRKLNENLD